MEMIKTNLWIIKKKSYHPPPPPPSPYTHIHTKHVWIFACAKVETIHFWKVGTHCFWIRTRNLSWLGVRRTRDLKSFSWTLDGFIRIKYSLSKPWNLIISYELWISNCDNFVRRTGRMEKCLVEISVLNYEVYCLSTGSVNQEFSIHCLN